VQEARADAAAAKLKAMIHVTATVVRDGAAKEMPLRDLVPGDIIKLSAGDMIPGDVRVLSAKDLFVSQGSLTGESFPVEKFHDPRPRRRAHPPSSRTSASWGPASKAARRPRSWSPRGPHLSRQHGGLDHGRPPPTSFDQGLSRFTWLMIRLMAVMVPLVFLINGFTKHDWKAPFSSRWPWPWASRPRCCP
jgi:Mg2+-importing ATPase